MARSGPLLTLTAGGALAAVLLVASMNAADDGDAGETGLVAGQTPSTAPATPSQATEQPPESEQPEEPEEAEQPEPVPYVGWVDGDLATLAIIVTGRKATAYVCDGDTVEAWLRGEADRGDLRLTGAAGELVGRYDGTGATGEVSVGDLTVDFAIDLVEPPAGLYAAADTIAGAEVEGSWVVLPDGTQVGFTYVDGEQVPAVEIDPDRGEVEIEGRQVPVEPVTGWDE